MKSLEELIKHKHVRSADRANMKRMLEQMKRGKVLDYQERLNLAAYLSRYRAYLPDALREPSRRGIE